VSRADLGVKQGRGRVIGRADRVQAARPSRRWALTTHFRCELSELSNSQRGEPHRSRRRRQHLGFTQQPRRRTPTTATMSRNDYGSDAEEDNMAGGQVQYDGMDELDRMPSIGSNQDIHAQLQAAATPLEFQATLETKFASYDNYCNLFHYILNSDGPVDLEVPNVRTASSRKQPE
jgi:hypothetical protein